MSAHLPAVHVVVSGPDPDCVFCAVFDQREYAEEFARMFPQDKSHDGMRVITATVNVIGSGFQPGMRAFEVYLEHIGEPVRIDEEPPVGRFVRSIKYQRLRGTPLAVFPVLAVSKRDAEAEAKNLRRLHRDDIWSEHRGESEE